MNNKNARSNNIKHKHQLVVLTTKRQMRKIFDLALIINLFSLATNITKDKHQLVVLDNQTLAEKNVWHHNNYQFVLTCYQCYKGSTSACCSWQPNFSCKIFALTLIINLFSLLTNVTKDKHQYVVLDKNVWPCSHNKWEMWKWTEN